ncbi:hypothetical protein [Halalkalicoccus sp. NIPERK01]|uniref:hypothetical protein n=1 Tax=Halalkalicoccus sp. NIPERK01 TaxID=3053469 RepID=UPI00256F52FA|nr:hypothetical protein [Halalkalicoccus sp. NIPERK01]MDL5363913.1 hypothetical protein [Halalkalicoccus sp. NIPERK01]
MASDRYLSDADSERASPSLEERVAAARAVVYGDDGELIASEELDRALAEYGVGIGKSEDGLPEYRDVPQELSLSACHMAVDLRRDPAEFIAPRA